MIFQEIFLAQDHAAERATLAVDIFGRGVHDDVGAELERPLKRRRRERVVDDQPRAALVRDLGDGLEINDRQCRIGRRLQEQQFRLRPHRGLPLIDVAAVHQRMRNAETRQDFLDHMAAGAEHRLGRDHVIAGAQRAQERRGDRRHAAGCGARDRRTLQRGHALFEHRDGGVSEAAVLIADGFAGEAGFGFLGSLIGIT